MATDDYRYLQKHLAVWKNKKVLRRIYGEQLYRRLLENCAPGSRTVEIGSGPGFIQQFAPSVWRTDILFSSRIHCVVDAHHLPFFSGGVDNVIGLDVLHHLNQPVAALREMARVLHPGGRLVLVEPWITPFSRFVYDYLHQEHCDFQAIPWVETEPQFGASKQAFDGNPALPYLLLERNQGQLAALVPLLKLQSVETFSFITYLLSLGFKRGSLLPNAVYPLLYGFEQFTRPLWANLAALRAVIVWEKLS